MEYKLLIIKNRYTKKLNFKLGLEWFEKNTPIKIVTEEVSTDLDFTYGKVSNSKYTAGSIPKNAHKLLTSVPRNKYDVVVLIDGNEVPVIGVSACYDNPLYPETDLIFLYKLNDGGKTLNHEIIHALFKRLARKGIVLKDPMDSYKNDSSLTSKDSNRTDALKLLEPHWNKLFMSVPQVQVTITRNKSTKKETTGSLVATNGGAIFMCKTLELPWLNNAPNISCIPPGEYDVVWSLSPRLMKWTYEVKNVPNRSGIRLHSGNYFKDFLGCIGLGATLQDINSDGELDITNTKATIAAFEGFMQKKSFKLKII